MPQNRDGVIYSGGGRVRVSMSESHRSCGKVLPTVNCCMCEGSLFISKDLRRWEAELCAWWRNYFDQQSWLLYLMPGLLSLCLPIRGSLLAWHWWKTDHHSWTRALSGGSRKQEAGGGAAKAALSPPLALHRPDAVSQERKSRWVEKGCNLQLHQAGIIFFKRTPEHRGSCPSRGRGVPIPWTTGA